MALWEYGSSSVNDLGRKLYLDSGTLTPLLKNLEAKGYVKKDRSKDDERSVTISLTPEGVKLKDKVMSIPGMMASCISLPQDKAIQLYNILYEVLGQLNKENEKN
jgi:DNA-binding MarR family transcriptional regulator